MRPKLAVLLLCSLISAAPLHGAVSLPVEGASALPSDAEGPAKEALAAFRDGRHVKAVELATPLAEQGNADALYLMGFASESGQGLDLSRDKALEYYRKAAATGHKDATYRLSFILLASEEEAERNQAREALEAAAKDDPAIAGRILGEAYLRGRLSKDADHEKTLFWWSRAADAGDLPSLLLLARLHEGQFGFPEKKDVKKALAAYGKAAGLGDASAMVALGSRLLNGDAAIRDEAKGREWLGKAIDAKEYSAYLALGDFEENVKKDPKAALAQYERGKDAGQIDCILRAADFYIEGKGTEKDPKRAEVLLETAAKGGSPVAHFRLAVQHLSVENGDVPTGYGHLLSAATGGLVEAQNELGLFYLSGKLAVADPVSAVAWLTRAAQAGYAQAQNNLATLYERGAGVPQNLNNAGQLYSLAANQGHGPATLALARMHAQGIGTEINPVKAWALATLADERGAEEAKTFASEIDKSLDEKQRVAARKELEDIKSGKTAEAPAGTAVPDKP